jgi:hypothetical protein
MARRARMRHIVIAPASLFPEVEIGQVRKFDEFPPDIAPSKSAFPTITVGPRTMAFPSVKVGDVLKLVQDNSGGSAIEIGGDSHLVDVLNDSYGMDLPELRCIVVAVVRNADEGSEGGEQP